MAASDPGDRGVPPPPRRLLVPRLRVLGLPPFRADRAHQRVRSPRGIGLRSSDIRAPPRRPARHTSGTGRFPPRGLSVPPAARPPPHGDDSPGLPPCFQGGRTTLRGRSTGQGNCPKPLAGGGAALLPLTDRPG